MRQLNQYINVSVRTNDYASTFGAIRVSVPTPYLRFGGMRPPLELDGAVSVRWERFRVLGREPQLAGGDLGVQTRRQQRVRGAGPSAATSTIKITYISIVQS